jgi:hypothetical protein
MCKELWIEAYETEIMNICEERDIEADEAEKILEDILRKDSHYLDGR